MDIQNDIQNEGKLMISTNLSQLMSTQAYAQ